MKSHYRIKANNELKDIVSMWRTEGRRERMPLFCLSSNTYIIILLK